MNAPRSENYEVKAGMRLKQYSWRYLPLVKCGPPMEDAGEPIIIRNIRLNMKTTMTKEMRTTTE